MALLGRLLEAAQRLEQDSFRPFFAAEGLTLGEFDVLATLRRAGAPYALSPKALLQATMVTSGAITGRVDKLERGGWVERRPDPQDRRALKVGLTAEGLARIDALMPRHVANEQRVLAHLSPEEQSQLNHLLARLLDGWAGSGGSDGDQA